MEMCLNKINKNMEYQITNIKLHLTHLSKKFEKEYDETLILHKGSRQKSLQKIKYREQCLILKDKINFINVIIKKINKNEYDVPTLQFIDRLK